MKILRIKVMQMEKQKVRPKILTEENEVITLSKGFKHATLQDIKETMVDKKEENITRIDHLSAILSRKSLDT